MVKKDEVVRFVTDKEVVDSLDLLAEKTKTNRSVVMRELIPPFAVIGAMAEQAALEGRSGRNIARDVAVSCVPRLAERMVSDPDHPIGLQFEILCGGIDPLIKTALLYIKWARAKMRTRGYRFEQVLYHGKARFAIAIGPGDTDAAVGALKRQIIDYAEKLGL